MPQCTFCGAKEEKETPLCHACGAIRYPIEKKSSTGTSTQDRLKISAVVAAAVVTPGSLIALALMGVVRHKTKNKKL